MDIDWSKKPEEFPIWIESLIMGPGSGWHRRVHSGFVSEDGCFWKNSDCKKYTVCYRPADEPAAWDGEGLPPVGTVCEMHYFKLGENTWNAVEIKYLGNQHAITEAGGIETHWRKCDVTFRQSRTPAQVVADERQSYINGMLCYDAFGGSRKGLAEALYDAGYRKIKEAE